MKMILLKIFQEVDILFIYNYNLASFMILLINTYSINEFPTTYHLDQLRNIKIIGNAFDNPELLYN